MRIGTLGHSGMRVAALAMTLAWNSPGTAHESTDPDEAAQPADTDRHALVEWPVEQRLTQPALNAARGRELFLTKGCVACHAVNGIGGHDATPLDAHTMEREMNPFDLAAKMWAAAPYMIASQEDALGYQILFTGEEFGDIVAFLHDEAEQHRLTEADLTDEIRRMMDHQHSMPGGGPTEHADEIGHGQMMQEQTGTE